MPFSLMTSEKGTLSFNVEICATAVRLTYQIVLHVMNCTLYDFHYHLTVSSD